MSIFETVLKIKRCFCNAFWYFRYAPIPKSAQKPLAFSRWSKVKKTRFFYINYLKKNPYFQNIIRSKFNDYSVESSFDYNKNFEKILELNYLLEPNLNQILIEYSLDSEIIIYHQNK